MTSKEIVKKLDEALKRFGTYSFDVKGPSEVMDLRPILASLRGMPASGAAEVINELAGLRKHDGRCKVLASRLVLCLDDWYALFDQPGIEELYD